MRECGEGGACAAAVAVAVMKWTCGRSCAYALCVRPSARDASIPLLPTPLAWPSDHGRFGAGIATSADDARCEMGVLARLRAPSATGLPSRTLSWLLLRRALRG